MDSKNLIITLNNLKSKMPDLIIRKIKCGIFKCVYVCSIETISSSITINSFILKYISKGFKNYKNIPNLNFKIINKESDALELLYKGFTIVIYKNNVYAFETKGDLDQGITESENDPSIRGSKEAFSENYQKTIGLIRKRIKNKDLVLEEITKNNKIGILYIESISNKETVNELKNKINNINDNLLDINDIKDFLDKENHTLFPTLLFTENPSNACRYLLEGRIIIVMENSVSACILPTFFVDYFKTSEDYYHKTFYASFVRLIRLLAFFLSIITPAFFIAILSYDPEVIPASLLTNFIKQRMDVPFPIVIEAFLLMLIFELLYEADSRVSKSRGTSLSIVGALVLGEAAVNAGIVSPIMVIIISFTSICTLIFNYYDSQGVIRFYRYFLMIITSLFGMIGFIIGLQFFLLDISSIKTFSYPYTLPTSPFIKNASDDAYLKLKNIKRSIPFLRRKS